MLLLSAHLHLDARPVHVEISAMVLVPGGRHLAVEMPVAGL